uniref:Plastocyanin-like domain-containing protein n=1 Tax=Oryza nivara TaxID=4536 RepID=A0A0E0FJL6_ORYNI
MMRCSRRLLCSLFLAIAALCIHVLDYVRKLAVTINGHTLGPTIHAVQGDTIVVNVKNSLLTENVAIHWHDIRQIGTPWADGTEGHTVLLNDWWHQSTYEQAAGLVFVPMVWVGEPQSLLINGRSRFMNCSSSPATECAIDATAAVVPPRVRGCGRFGAYFSWRPARCTLDGADVGFTYDSDTRRTCSQWGPHWINLSQGQTGL